MFNYQSDLEPCKGFALLKYGEGRSCKGMKKTLIKL